MEIFTKLYNFPINEKLKLNFIHETEMKIIKIIQTKITDEVITEIGFFFEHTQG